MTVGWDGGSCLHVVEVDTVALIVLLVALLVIIVVGQVVALHSLGQD